MTEKEIKKATEEIIGYFGDYEITTTDFDLKECACAFGFPISDMHVLLCNLEDRHVMLGISHGIYDSDSFNIEDESIFNDCYHDMMQDLGYEESDEEE